MLRKAAASLLLILTASPFTAPFATCDVPTLFGVQTPLSLTQQVTLAWTVEDDAHAIAPGATARRVRDGLKLIPNAQGLAARRRPAALLEKHARAGASAVAPHASPPSRSPLRI